MMEPNGVIVGMFGSVQTDFMHYLNYNIIWNIELNYCLNPHRDRITNMINSQLIGQRLFRVRGTFDPIRDECAYPRNRLNLDAFIGGVIP